MYYSYVEIEYVATSFSPARTDLAVKLLTPVTIMVADRIGAVRSRKLLKVLLDSGSTTTLINKKCLPNKCKPCQISQSRMVNTLAGSYQLSAMVVMHNSRFPELDKNRNVEQQKALIFESDTCRYDVILGVDFWPKLELISNTAQAP
jgi:hypothetical protein